MIFFYLFYGQKIELMRYLSKSIRSSGLCAFNCQIYFRYEILKHDGTGGFKLLKLLLAHPIITLLKEELEFKKNNLNKFYLLIRIVSVFVEFSRNSIALVSIIGWCLKFDLELLLFVATVDTVC